MKFLFFTLTYSRFLVEIKHERNYVCFNQQRSLSLFINTNYTINIYRNLYSIIHWNMLKKQTHTSNYLRLKKKYIK